MVLAQNLKALRRTRALTQQALADRAGVHRVTIARIEAGADAPAASTTRRLAEALDVPVEALRKGESGNGPEVDAPASVAVTGLLAAGIEIAEEDLAGVLKFARHPAIAGLLLDAVEQAGRYFPSASLVLRFLVDPEEGDEQLFLGIRPAGDWDEAFATRRRFDEEWWFENAARAPGDLIVDIA